MEKQIKLALLSTMLFTGAISAMEQSGSEESKASEQVQKIAPASKPADLGTSKAADANSTNNSTNVAENAKIKKEEKAEIKKEVASTEEQKTEASSLAKLGTTLKEFVTNKWVLGTGAAVVGLYIAYKVYQAYNNEEAEDSVLS